MVTDVKIIINDNNDNQMVITPATKPNQPNVTYSYGKKLRSWPGLFVITLSITVAYQWGEIIQEIVKSGR